MAALFLASAFRGHPALETCLYARLLLDRFALDTIRLHKPEVGRRSQSTAKLFSLSHGTVFLRPRLKSLRDLRLK